MTNILPSKKEEIIFWTEADIVKNETIIRYESTPNNPSSFITTSFAPIYNGLLVNVGTIIIKKDVTILPNISEIVNITFTIQFQDGFTTLVSIQAYNSTSRFIAGELAGSYVYASGKFFNKNPTYVFNILPDKTRRIIITYDS